MAYSQTARTISYAVLGGLIGALAVGAIALMMPIPGSGGAPFFVAAAMLMGMGSMSWVAGWTLHLVTGLVIGAIFGVFLVKVSRLGLKTTGRALVLGGVAGLAAFVVFFIPMMAMLMPALMGMPDGRWRTGRSRDIRASPGRSNFARDSQDQVVV